MSTSFRRYVPEQVLLLPPSVRDWLPEDHLAYFISDTIDSLRLKAFYKRYEGDGRRNQPFEPKMMLKVLVYAYATGTFSSRKIAQKLHEDVAFRVLAAENFPKHRTVAEFRQRHLGDLGSLFEQVVRLAQEVGLVKLGTVGVDGSKVKANASKHKSMSYKRMKEQTKRLRKEIRGLLARAESTDAAEDAEYGAEFSGDEIPEELARRESRLKKIQEAQKRLEARQRSEDEERGRHPDDDEKPPSVGGRYKRSFGVPEDKAQENFTDPDSRIMRRSGSGFEQCYNAQIAVDRERQLIVATGVVQSASDVKELLPMLERVKETFKQPVERVLADAGYKSEANFEALEERGIDGYVALGREGKKTCEIDSSRPATQRMDRKLRTKIGEKRYRERKHVAEPPFGWVKSVLGFDRFSVRGLEPAQGEWRLACLATNLRRMHGMMAWC